VSATSSEQFPLFKENDNPYGLTYGEWTARWWQWALSIPKLANPVADETGKQWKSSQPLSDAYFLAGNIPTMNMVFPHRIVKMEFGRGVLLPVLNCEANTLEYPDLKTHDDLLRHVVNDVNTVVKKELFINGIRIESERIPSNPRIFSVSICNNNAFGIENIGSCDATADGYWAFLKPLPKGNYSIHFEGSCENGRLKAGAFYELEIY
jgi:hypothetical protein